ncbi:hypothetical protein ANANG_G00169240 [Anguilla anguilla]|uniref:HMG box domain-containing protein n=1 Tax=Anguilla anguilla TaxID=7936 RepID=A0A9D3RSW6_ANGAN|nr:hypothetical protein ANANG_G00169240 [Anguilla anguilla]
MDLNFYSDLSDGAGQHGDSEFLDSQSYNGYDSVNKFPGGNDNFLTIPGAGHPFLSSSEVQTLLCSTFHTPSLGDEEFEIPPISLDPDSALTVSDVVSHFGELSDGGGVEDASVTSAVVGGNDPSFASTFVNPPSQGLEHLSLGVMSQPGGGALLSSTLGMDLGHSIGSHFSSSSPMTIDVPLSDMGHGLLGHNQLTTIDQSELSSQLGLSLGGGTIMPRPRSPEQPLSATPSPSGSLQDEDLDDFKQKSVLVDSPASMSISLSPSVSSSAPPSSAAAARPPRWWAEPGRHQGPEPQRHLREVSKIVASMWDSLGEEQKQVYKRKTEAAKKEYLKALAAYRANQLSQMNTEVMDNTITNICTSNIILDLPQVTTRSRTGAHKAPAPNPAPAPPQPPTVTKIIISKHMLAGPAASGQQIPTSLVTAKPRGAEPGGRGRVCRVHPAPSLQIKIVPAPVKAELAAPFIVTTTAVSAGSSSSAVSAQACSSPAVPLQVVQSAATAVATGSSPSAAEEMAEEFTSGEMEVEVNVAPGPEDSAPPGPPARCIRAGCTNAPVESKDWDREYCSNECVATHCRDIFMAWCSIRGQNSTTVK